MKVLIELKLLEDALFSDAYGAFQQALKMEIISATPDPLEIETMSLMVGQKYLTETLDNLKVMKIAFPDGKEFPWQNLRPTNPDCIGIQLIQIGSRFALIGMMREGWEPIKTH